jgi:tagatose-1,6-bisphosphate aldolase
MIGLQTRRHAEIVADGNAAFPKFEQQLNILKSAQSRFDSALFDMVEIVQADLFDNELEAAQELGRKGFARGAGAVAGVVLERHLARIAAKHSLKSRKSAPTINDLNQVLKDNDIIDIATWRFVQHLGDLRNLCDHDKGPDPTKDQIDDLIAGVSKIVKTIL